MGAHAELAGRVAVVTGVTRHAGLGAAIARELVDASASVFATHFREYDERQTWGVAPNEPESILAGLGGRCVGFELDLSNPAAAVDTLAPDTLFTEFKQNGVSFVLAFSRLRNE